MEKQSFNRRFAYPVSVVFVIMVLSMVTYHQSRSIDSVAVHRMLATVSGTTWFLSVAFGSFFVYAVAFMRGATMTERLLAMSVTPLAWATKEVFRLSESHTVAECLYWYLNPLNIWLVSFMVLEAGLADIFCRFLMKRKGQAIRVANPQSLATVIASLVFAISCYAWGKGENIYVIFLAGYRGTVRFRRVIDHDGSAKTRYLRYANPSSRRRTFRMPHSSGFASRISGIFRNRLFLRRHR